MHRVYAPSRGKGEAQDARRQIQSTRSLNALKITKSQGAILATAQKKAATVTGSGFYFFRKSD